MLILEIPKFPFGFTSINSDDYFPPKFIIKCVDFDFDIDIFSFLEGYQYHKLRKASQNYITKNELLSKSYVGLKSPIAARIVW